MGESGDTATVVYHLCPQCFRATPEGAHERYCPNDGSAMLERCPSCAATITSPYDRFCRSCGHGFSMPASERSEAEPDQHR